MDTTGKLDVSTAGKQLGKVIEALPATGPIQLTRYGKVVAVLNLPATSAEQRHGQRLMTKGDFAVSDTPPHGYKVINDPTSAKARQAARDALLNAVNKTKKNG